MYVRKVAEVHHSTHEQLVGYAKDAVSVADEAGLEASDRLALLPVIFTAVQSKQVYMEQGNIAPTMAIPKNHR